MSLNDALVFVEKSFLSPLVGAQCAHDIRKLDFAHQQCFKLLISKVLSLGITAGGMILKVPQIIKIMRAKSAVGISFASYFLETIAYTISLVYNIRGQNPFLTYGEMAFITIQNVFVLVLILGYSKRFFSLVAFLGIYTVASIALLDPVTVTPDLLKSLQWSTVLIGVGSKLPQIFNNFSAKSTGQLSAITVFLQGAGAAARVFTTLQEVDDPIILSSNIIATALNAVLALQMVAYWNSRQVVDGVQHLRSKKSPSKNRTKKFA
ncbi:hypothetical protein DFS34DRAFT_337943 [Phlyctochytrium arcticum]|nr:hypothetical protein DFS34DRAFT_337943 [Phlyctochytrium arcticum]